MQVTIKEEYLNRVVGFNNSALPLGKRDDLVVLAEMAQRSQNPNLLKLFEELPSLKEIEEFKAGIFIEEHPVPEPKQKTKKK